MIPIPGESDREKKNEKSEDRGLRPCQKYLGPVQWNAVNDSLLEEISGQHTYPQDCCNRYAVRAPSKLACSSRCKSGPGKA